jgi:hypothetical protein
VLLHLAPHLRLDLSLDLQDLDLAVEEADDDAETLGDVRRLQDGLPLLRLDVDVGGDEVGQVAGVLDACDHDGHLLGTFSIRLMACWKIELAARRGPPAQRWV